MYIRFILHLGNVVQFLYLRASDILYISAKQYKYISTFEYFQGQSIFKTLYRVTGVNKTELCTAHVERKLSFTAKYLSDHVERKVSKYNPLVAPSKNSLVMPYLSCVHIHSLSSD